MGSQQDDSVLAVRRTQRSCRRTKVQEAVVFSFAEETQVVNRMRKLFAEDGFQQAIVEVYCDSKSESTLVKIIVCLRRLKGVDTSRQVIGEMIAELVFKVVRSEKAYQAENITKVTTGRMLQADKELFKDGLVFDDDDDDQEFDIIKDFGC
ncbi:hypothetical protein AT4G03165 [Arabidopsis thaliana]|uniref:Uncharacterized protein n=1 Tax=Arabidopsis thaliana TaxID=3702 RepID=F4JI58_ARATH|nr:uncharacterized protein AT4G03165 [Arabidopsis thaliana]AEE82283.1 hypothetical protein AT4G03165 [Arabidopsis thaliana]|eukprot:NP_680567.1 hypothetical protein AT4G03165 [Arabidopsis thaliana]